MSTAAAVCIGRDAGMTGVSFEHMGKLGKGLTPREAGFTAIGDDARLRRQTSEVRWQTSPCLPISKETLILRFNQRFLKSPGPLVFGSNP